MPTLSVIRASGEEVLPDISVEADVSFKELAHAAADRLAVVPSRCVLLSPAGDRMAHTQTPSNATLVDGDVITVLVFAAPRVFAHRRGQAFAAVKGDGSVVTWGDEESGGDFEEVKSELTGGVEHVVGTCLAFAAVKEDGSVVTWGFANYGGNSDAVRSQLTSGVRHVVGSDTAFAAVKEDGSVVTWGVGGGGGNSDAVRSHLTSGVRHVVGSDNAFAAVKEDGSVVTWGIAETGGNSDAVKSQLQGVEHVVGNVFAFAAVKKDGSVVTWGDARREATLMESGASLPAVFATLSGMTKPSQQ